MINKQQVSKPRKGLIQHNITQSFPHSQTLTTHGVHNYTTNTNTTHGNWHEQAAQRILPYPRLPRQCGTGPNQNDLHLVQPKTAKMIAIFSKSM